MLLGGCGRRSQECTEHDWALQQSRRETPPTHEDTQVPVSDLSLSVLSALMAYLSMHTLRCDIVYLTCSKKSVYSQLTSTAAWHSAIGDRALAVAGPRAWNSLPVDLRLSGTFSTIKTHVKWHLFNISKYHSLRFDCIVDYFGTEPLKPLVLHMPLLIYHYYITLHGTNRQIKGNDLIINKLA